ncbi:MAG TPA: tetratricopeptide repeat protein, partial [Pirellulales bacterium]|nr:tetratricopeptide repeat protein [Pirellulales bacterium]
MMTAMDDELAGAWQAYHSGEAASAHAICERLLRGEGENNLGALFLVSLIDHERGQHHAAIARLTRVVQLQPRYAEAHNNLGNAFAADGQLPSAEKCFREALRCKPQYAEALNNLGNALRDQRKLDEAIDQYHVALQFKPDYGECHNNLGIALARKKRFDEAIASYGRALALNPTFAEPQNNLGIALAAQGRLEEAVEAFRRAIDLKPSYVDALANLGLTLVDLGRLDEAIAAYRRAVALAPRAARLHNGLGIAIAKCAWTPGTVADGHGGPHRHDLNDAVTAFHAAIDIEPEFAEAHNNLGNALRESGHLAEAEQHLHRALTLKPDYAQAHNNLGVVMVKGRRIAEAAASYNRALRLKPDYAEAHLNRALAWLASGDFRQGWMEYEWRWRTSGFKELQCPQPRWDGGLVDGKTVLLWAEQGLGDTFQFVRYARLVRQRGARVWLRAPRSLHPILSRTPGIDRLVAEDEERFDCHAPLASLPRLFATTLEDVPGAEPYLFPDERLVADWTKKICETAAPESAFKIGIAWQGNPRFAADRQRSIPLSSLLPLADIPGVQLISLQKGAGSEQLEAAAPEKSSSAILNLG